jgi:hypothetical protein
MDPALSAEHEAAAAALEAAKASCTDGCVDEAQHDPHRAELEQAYARFAAASAAVVAAEDAAHRVAGEPTSAEAQPAVSPTVTADPVQPA